MTSKRFLFGLMTAAILMGCKNETSLSTREEIYGQEHPVEKETDFLISQKKSHTIPESILSAMNVQISINNEDVKECILNKDTNLPGSPISDSLYRLEEEPDGTILFTALLNGVLEKTTDGWTTYCIVNLSFPWSVESVRTLPDSWKFDQSHLAEKGVNLANFHARAYSGVTMFKDKGNSETEPETYEYQALYPWPPGKDPKYIELNGDVTVLEKSIISFNEPLKAFLESETIGIDNSGNIINTTVSMQQY